MFKTRLKPTLSTYQFGHGLQQSPVSQVNFLAQGVFPPAESTVEGYMLQRHSDNIKIQVELLSSIVCGLRVGESNK